MKERETVSYTKAYWTPEEEDELEGFCLSGANLKTTSEKLGRSYYSVKSKAYCMGYKIRKGRFYKEGTSSSTVGSHMVLPTRPSLWRRLQDAWGGK